VEGRAAGSKAGGPAGDRRSRREDAAVQPDHRDRAGRIDDAEHVRRFTDTDVRGTIAAFADWWRLMTVGLPDPSPANVHAAAASAALRTLAEALGAAMANVDASGGRERDTEALVSSVVTAWDRSEAAPERRAHAEAFLHVMLGSLHAAGRSLRTDANGPGTVTGTVANLHAGGGGVPKPAVERATITIGGLSGDRQRTRQHHGRPWQAVCLWSAEVIEALAADGHPIFPGAAGENLTLRGIDWSLVRPGLLLRVGDALVETSLWALPCRHNARWFSDGSFVRIHHDRGPVSRMYATVREPGEVAVGHAAVLEPG
jgi:hypothetical protein